MEYICILECITCIVHIQYLCSVGRIVRVLFACVYVYIYRVTNIMAQLGQDWSYVTWNKSKPTAKQSRDERSINEAFRKGGEISVEKKRLGGMNKSATSQVSNIHKLENETEDFRSKHIGHEFKIALQKARQNKGMTQAELAKAINEKGTVITEYENGKAIPNGAVIQKLNKVLGIALPKCTK